MSEFPRGLTDQGSDAAAGAEPTVAILTLGCKLNLADSEAMARRMRDAGWAVSERAAGADAVIVNSCSVTHVADAKSRHLVRMAQRRAPGATVALTGCMLETAAPQTVEALGADLAYRQVEQGRLTQRLIDARPRPDAATHEGTDDGAVPGAGIPPGVGMTSGVGVRQPAVGVAAPRALRTRAFVSAQEGCNDVCAFCIVPKTRGRERSKSIEAVVAEVQARDAEGVREVVITGTQLGAWGRDEGRAGLAPLLRALLERTSVPRIRISSVQPQDLSDEMIAAWQDPRLCRHLHLALQSGSGTVLERMRRRYSAQEYRKAVWLLRERIPGVAITTDVIAGFPGETEEEFEETFDFCREMRFAAMHVFPYSQRLGTVAAKMPGQVAENVKKERVRRLMELAHEMSASYREQLLCTRPTVLWESAVQDEDGATVWDGLTDTYVRVFARSDAVLENKLTPALITGLCEGGVSAEVDASCR
jgi:threonylcarbamoyladenosine tRNA methylthiotransferase MtaB